MRRTGGEKLGMGMNGEEMKRGESGEGEGISLLPSSSTEPGAVGLPLAQEKCYGIIGRVYIERRTYHLMSGTVSGVCMCGIGVSASASCMGGTRFLS